MFGDLFFKALRLAGDETELRQVSWQILSFTVVAQLSWITQYKHSVTDNSRESWQYNMQTM